MTLAFVDGCRVYGDRQHRLIERIALDTAIGFHMDVVKTLLSLDEWTWATDIGDRAGISHGVAIRKLQDLHTLGVIEKDIGTRPAKNGGRNNVTVYQLKKNVRRLWRQAGIENGQ
jgi:hypothetical protein